MRIKVIETTDVRQNEYQRVYAQVDLDAIMDNVIHMKENIGDKAQMIGVIKTDGYGHGSVAIAHCLEPLDFMYGFAVATVEEAHILRLCGVKKPVLILGYTFPYCYELLAEENIHQAVFRRDSLAQLSEAARRTGKQIMVHIKVDTGMNRIGITPDEEGIAFVKEVCRTPGLLLEGIFTHFARADEADKTETMHQAAVFKEFIARIKEECGITIPVCHCSNSASIVELPQISMDAVRPGITLYGLHPSNEVSTDKVLLRPALSLYSHIVYVKPLHKGQSVSYGGTFTAREQMRIATIPVGYGDGYPRTLSGKGHVLIHGKKAPILGRVCMDQFMVDVTDIPEASEGDLVTLIGRDGEEEISAEYLGELSGRFNYELVCDLSRRIPRVYLQDGRVVGTRDCLHEYSMNDKV